MFHYISNERISKVQIFLPYQTESSHNHYAFLGRKHYDYNPDKRTYALLAGRRFSKYLKGHCSSKNQIVHISDEGLYTMTDGAVFQGRKRNLSQHKQIRKELGLNTQNLSEVSEDSSLQLFDNCSFLNDMPLAFCIIELVFDAEGHGVDFVFRYCNDEMTVVEGVPVSEMLNRSFYEVFENGDKNGLSLMQM